jgi:hypothetical protein
MGGFLTDTFVRPISPKAADNIDKGIGKPVGQAGTAVGAAVGTVLGGSMAAKHTEDQAGTLGPFGPGGGPANGNQFPPGPEAPKCPAGPVPGGPVLCGGD